MLRKLYISFKRAIDRFSQGWRDSDIRAVMESFEEVRNLPGFSWSKEAIQIRNLLVKGSKEAPLKSWAFIRAIPVHEGEVTSLDTAHDSLSILTGSIDGRAALWDVVSGNLIKSFPVNSPVRKVYFIHEINKVITWSEDNILRLWGLDGNLLLEIDEVYPPLSLDQGRQYMLAMSVDISPIRIELSSGRKLPFGSSITEEERLVCITADWEFIYCIRDDVRVRRLYRKSGQRVGALRDASAKVTSVMPARAGDKVLTGLETGDVSVFLVGSGMDIATLRGHVDVINTLDESPHADVWVTGSDDFDVRLWDISKETCLAALEGHSHPVRSVRFFPNFSMIASGSSNGKVRIWGLEWEVSRQRLF